MRKMSDLLSQRLQQRPSFPAISASKKTGLIWSDWKSVRVEDPTPFRTERKFILVYAGHLAGDDGFALAEQDLVL